MHWFNLVLLLLLAFVVGRWTASLGLQDAVLSEVMPEERPHLYMPPVGHGSVTVPSVIRDARGEIHNLEAGGTRFNVLVTRAGAMRSGDVHRSRQLDLIFSGKVAVTTREHGRDVRREYLAGSLIVIPANVPHIFDFINDSVMAEWWPDDSFEVRAQCECHCY